MSYTGTAFAEWLHGKHDPVWKRNLDRSNPLLFKEVGMSQEQLEKILEKLDEWDIFKNPDEN